MNRLATEDGPAGDATCVFPFSRFSWFVSDVVVFGLYSYCTYMVGMMNYGLQLLNWWKLHELENGIGG